MALIWERDGADWPHREHSRFVEAGGLRWHVQVAGRGPALLLLHGTGASSHSWRGLIGSLAERFTVVAPDLPGHGFSSPPQTRAGYGLPGVAGSLAALAAALELDPKGIMGHSAGAAIAVRMVVEHGVRPERLLAINGAVLPLPGMPVPLFALAARLLAAPAWVSSLVARRAADGNAVSRLIHDTGSRLDPDGLEHYQRLLRDPDHVRAVLSMMGQWDLRLLQRDLPALDVPLTLAVGGRDRTIPPTEAERVVRLVPHARIERFEDLGHLAHEEQPEAFVALLETLAASGTP